MKRILLAMLAMAISVPAAAQLYKWVDKDGKVFYSDTPPPDRETKQIKAPTGPATSAPPKSALQRDKELDKTRKASSDGAKKAEDEAKNSEKNERACNAARQHELQFSSGGRILSPNPSAAGEREYMTDEQIAAGLAKARRDVEELCKKS